MALNVAHQPTRHPSFWGDCTATLDWCEENYHLTPFIAEFCKKPPQCCDNNDRLLFI